MRSPLALLLLLPVSVFAQAPTLKAPPGFQVELVLQAPDIEAPTALCVAPNGDVYYAEDPMDMRGPPTVPNDKIWLMKGGDPKKRICIAEKMWAVMGLEIVRDKLYVVHPPYVTVFTLDADGKPTKREDLFTDLGPKFAGSPGFNDHVPGAIRMGMDGYLYVSIGDKGIPKMTRKETNQGSVHVAEGRWNYTREGNHISLEGGGAIRFRPDGSKLEVFASGTRNHLDVPLDPFDRIFVRDNTNDGGGWNTRLMQLPRGGFLGYPWAFTKEPERIIPAITDFGGGSPCGGFVYADDGLPEEYRGRVFHCEWGKGKVFAVRLKADGASHTFADEITFLDPTGTSIKDFRPFSLRPTADGRGFYVTDWAYSGWSNPTVAGRLWKVTYTGTDNAMSPRLTKSTTLAELVAALAHPAHSERLRVQRELEARCQTDESKAELQKIAATQLADAKAAPALKRHLIWALANVNALTSAAGTGTEEAITRLANIALADADATVRAEAARALGLSQNEACVFDLTPAFKDPSPHVRLNVLTAMFDASPTGKMQFANVNALLPMVDDADPMVRHLAVRLLQRHAANAAQPLCDRLVKGESGKDGSIWLALADTYEIRTMETLARTVPKLPTGELRARAVTLLARNARDRKPYPGTWWGTRPEQQPPPARIVDWEGTPIARDALLAALNDAEPIVSKAAMEGLIALADPEIFPTLEARYAGAPNAASRILLLRGIAASKHPKAVAFLSKVATDADADSQVRQTALAQLPSAPGIATTLGGIVASKADAAVRIAALQAFARLKLADGLVFVLPALRDETPTIRTAAVMTMVALNQSMNVDALLPLLDDADAMVRDATLDAFATLKSPTAIPKLVTMVGNEATQFRAITALAATPDLRAVSAYLTGMGSKNADLRRVSRAAMVSLRERAAPILEQLAERNELPREALAELRAVYTAQQPIMQWKVIGPFPNNDQAYPPEKAIDFDATYEGEEKKPVRWHDRTAEANGMVNLAGKYQPSEQVSVYAFATIDSKVARRTTLGIGSDDQATVWVNGKQVHRFGNNRGWTADNDLVTVELKAGRNTILIRSGNSSGPWAFSVSTALESRYKFLEAAPQKLDLAAYREFVRSTKGDAARGHKLFLDVKGVACIKCHAVAKEGGLVGPALDGIGAKYNREDLMTSILEPSKAIANGYETVVLILASGKSVQGVFKGETGEGVAVSDADGKVTVYAKDDIEEKRFSPVSTMPNGLNDGMTLQDFADIIAYLEARREEKPK